MSISIQLIRIKVETIFRIFRWQCGETDWMRRVSESMNRAGGKQKTQSFPGVLFRYADLHNGALSKSSSIQVQDVDFQRGERPKLEVFDRLNPISALCLYRSLLASGI